MYFFLANTLAIHIEKQDILAERKDLNVSLAAQEASNFQFPISIYSDMKWKQYHPIVILITIITYASA